MPPRDRQVSAEIGLPFLKIGTNDVGAFFKRRGRQPSGPFLFISASCGLALDTALHSNDGSHPHLWGPHGQPHQLWYLEASGHGREVHIISPQVTTCCLMVRRQRLSTIPGCVDALRTVRLGNGGMSSPRLDFGRIASSMQEQAMRWTALTKLRQGRCPCSGSRMTGRTSSGYWPCHS